MYHYCYIERAGYRDVPLLLLKVELIIGMYYYCYRAGYRDVLLSGASYTMYHYCYIEYS